MHHMGSNQKGFKINIPPLSIPAYGKLLVLSFLVFIILLIFYTAVSHFFVISLWEAAAGLNTIIALGVIIRFVKKSPQFFAGTPLVSYLPGLFIFFSSMIMGLFLSQGKFNIGKIREIVTFQNLVIICMIIPLSEELVFRMGLSTLSAKIGGVFWGSFFSILVFTSLHMVPSFEALFQGNFTGNPLGPLFLGIFTEIIFRKWHNIFAAILFHMACNLTPYIFQATDPRWLAWLSALYN